MKQVWISSPLTLDPEFSSIVDAGFFPRRLRRLLKVPILVQQRHVSVRIPSVLYMNFYETHLPPPDFARVTFEPNFSRSSFIWFGLIHHRGKAETSSVF